MTRLGGARPKEEPQDAGLPATAFDPEELPQAQPVSAGGPAAPDEVQLAPGDFLEPDQSPVADWMDEDAPVPASPVPVPASPGDAQGEASPPPPSIWSHHSSPRTPSPAQGPPEEVADPIAEAARLAIERCTQPSQPPPAQAPPAVVPGPAGAEEGLAAQGGPLTAPSPLPDTVAPPPSPEAHPA